MIRIRQSIPDYVETDGGPKIFEGNTLEEVLSDPWLQSWVVDGKYARFCKEERTYHDFDTNTQTRSDLLMCESEDGKKWWVLGFVEEGTLDGLPEAMMVCG